MKTLRLSSIQKTSMKECDAWNDVDGYVDEDH